VGTRPDTRLGTRLGTRPDTRPGTRPDTRLGTRSVASVALGCLLAFACAGQAEPKSTPANAPAAPQVNVPPQAAFTDRSAEDVALDAGRKPLEFLRFAGVAQGMRVAELGAGGGYTAELLARAVGPTGQVFGQNSKFLLERFAEKPWSGRLQKQVMRNVTRVDREFDDPLPPEAKDLDVVVMNMFYHDTVWLKTDRAKMNAAIFAALKPGGVYVVVDHSARAGAGLRDAETLHRIDEADVKQEITHAGFTLAGEDSFLRNAQDTRDWSTSPGAAGPKRGQSDRFALRFKRP
jgi:predicted methyltransferase